MATLIIFLLFIVRFMTDAAKRKELIEKIESLTKQILKCPESKEFLKQLNEILENRPINKEKAQITRDFKEVSVPEPRNMIIYRIQGPIQSEN